MRRFPADWAYRGEAEATGVVVFSTSSRSSAVAAEMSGAAIRSRCIASIGPSPKYKPSETRKVMRMLSCFGAGRRSLSHGPIAAIIGLEVSMTFMISRSNAFGVPSTTAIFPD